MKQHARHVSHIAAIGFALAGYALWVLCDGCIKLAGQSPLPFYEVAGFMGLSGAAITLIKAFVRGEIKALKPNRPRAQAMRAVLTLGITFCNVIALRHLPFFIFYIMAFMAPLTIACLAAFFLHERLDWKKTIAILAGFAGVIIALYPSAENGSGDWIGYVIMGVAVLIGATNAVWMRRMSQTETVDSLVFSQMIMGMIAGFIPMLIHAERVNFTLLVILFAAGALDVAGVVCQSIALRHTTAANVAQFHYTQIISGAILGYLAWHEIPTLPLLAGSFIIIASGIYIAAQAEKTGAGQKVLTENDV